MTWKKFFLKKEPHSILKQAYKINNLKELETSNPYLVAKMQWNTMFFDINRSKRNWQIICTFLLFFSSILVVSLAYLANKNIFLPYIIHVDHLGDAQFVNLLKENSKIGPTEYRAFLSRYIINTFSILSDPIVQKNYLDFVYATSASKAINLLNDYYKANDPFELSKEFIKEIKVNSILPKSDQSWKITWTEIIRNKSGIIEQEKNYEGLVMLKQHAIKKYEQLLLNPLGLFVEYISWTQQL